MAISQRHKDKTVLTGNILYLLLDKSSVSDGVALNWRFCFLNKMTIAKLQTGVTIRLQCISYLFLLGIQMLWGFPVTRFILDLFNFT